MSKPETSWLDALSYADVSMAVALACDNVKIARFSDADRATILKACKRALADADVYSIPTQRIRKLKDWASCS